MLNCDFNGRVAIVTGASSGIGRATGQAFARCNAKVVLADVDENGGGQSLKLIKEAGGEAVFVKVDISDPKQVEALVSTTVETYGRLDYACNNAGIGGASSNVADKAIEDWNRVIAVNLTGVFLCMKYEIPQMLKTGAGAIVNMSSILGKVGFAGASAYVSSKHGLIGLTKTAALEYATLGIRVNAVCPAFIETPMIEQGGITPGTPIYDMLKNAHPVHRLGRPEEVANVVIWLCSTDASFLTGESILVDGGYVAQ